MANRYQHVDATLDSSHGGDARDLELVGGGGFSPDATHSQQHTPSPQQQQRAGLASFAPPLLADAGGAGGGGDSVGLSAPLRLARSKWARCGCELLAICVALVVAFLVGASTRPGEDTPSCAPSKPGPTIVLSFDGFRPSYLSATGTPNLWSLKSDRHTVFAQRMQPRFPSLTFPNHYALVTGLYPESHGITANHIFDPTTGNEFTCQSRTRTGHATL